MDGKGTGTVFYVNKSDTTINGFTIRNGDKGIVMPGGKYSVEPPIEMTNITISDNLIENCTYGVCPSGVGRWSLPAYFSMFNNTLQFNTVGVYSSGGDGNVTGNLFFRNGDGLSIPDNGRLAIENNIIFGSENGIYLGITRGGGSTEYHIRYFILNNRIYGNTNGIHFENRDYGNHGKDRRPS